MTSQRARSATHPPSLQTWRGALPLIHVNVTLSTTVGNDHFRHSIYHCIFMCIVAGENMLVCNNLLTLKRPPGSFLIRRDYLSRIFAILLSSLKSLYFIVILFKVHSFINHVKTKIIDKTHGTHRFRYAKKTDLLYDFHAVYSGIRHTNQRIRGSSGVSFPGNWSIGWWF